jgi:exosortase A
VPVTKLPTAPAPDLRLAPAKTPTSFDDWIQCVTAFPSTRRRQPIVGSSLAPGWRPALAAIAIASLVFAVVFQDEITGAVQVWIDSTAYNHCFLILPLIGFLLWERRAVIASVLPRPALWPLLLMPLLSAVWLIAAVLDIQEGRQLVMVAMFEVVVLIILGLRLFWLLLAPLLFLSFLVPSGAFLVPSLQTITADIVVAGLHALHIPVFSDGYMIEIPEGPFEIAEACAGLRFLIASIVFGCFFAVVMYRSPLRRTLFILMSIFVPIFANGLRALGIIVLAHLEGSASAVAADHVLYGWLFFTLVIMILIGIGMALVRKSDRTLADPPAATGGSSSEPAPWRFAVVVAAAILLAVAGPAYAARLDNLFPAALLPQADGPSVAPPWQILSGVSAEWHPLVRGADREFLESFEEPGSGIIVRFVGLYRLRALGNLLTTTENRLADDIEWRIAERHQAEVSWGDEKARVARAEIISGRHRRLVWSFYVVDGKIAAGLIETKLLQARAVLLRRASLAALVAVSASMDDPGDPAPAQLTRFLTASQPFPQYLTMLERETKTAARGS